MKNSISSNKKKAIDTNIVIYAVENQEHEKTEIALCILKNKPFVSNQVITETLNVLNGKRFNRNKEFCINTAIQLLEICPLIHNTRDVYYNAKYIMKKYKLQLYDSLIVSCAYLANCDILYSEDMYEVTIEKTMMIINPFKT